MKTLVTGATGFVGRCLVEHLARAGHDVSLLVLPHESQRAPNVARVFLGDLCEETSLARAVEGQDAVVHLAGAVGYGQTWANCRAINVEGTRNLARAALAAGVRRLVHMSSVAVYGRVSGVLLAEDSPRRKIGDPYRDTKVEAEELLQELASQGKLDLTIVRPTVIYGPGDDKFLPRLVENLRSGRARVIGRGDNGVDLTHVDDVVTFIALALADVRSIGGVFNLTAPTDMTWTELVALVSNKLDLAPPSRRLPYGTALMVAALMELVGRLTRTPPRLTRYAVRVIGRQYYYPITRARALGFTPKIDLAQGITRALLG
jgi:nucleoside-diphosphate-sugar epimerase